MLSKFGVVAWSDTRMLRNYYRVKFAEVAVDVNLNDIRYSWNYLEWLRTTWRIFYIRYTQKKKWVSSIHNFVSGLWEKLVCSSSVFATMFKSPMEESTTSILKLSDINFDTASVALRYIYTSEIRADLLIVVINLLPCLMKIVNIQSMQCLIHLTLLHFIWY